MTKELRVVNTLDSIYDVAKTMIDHQIETVLVSYNNKYVGIVTWFDLFKVLVDLDKITYDLRQISVQEIMSPVVTIDENSSLEEAAEVFSRQKITRLPVLTKKKRAVGIITIEDIMATRPDIYQKVSQYF